MHYLMHKKKCREIRQSANNELKCTGLNLESFLSLSHADGSKPMRDIAELAGLDVPSLSRVRNFLIENKFVKRLTPTGDKREVYIMRTAKGNRIVDRHGVTIKKILEG